MPIVLLLAVNRHQEIYFRKIADHSSDLDIRVLHDNKLPFLLKPGWLSSADALLLKKVVSLRLNTVEQESENYNINHVRRFFLSIRYWFAGYIFLLRTREFFRKNKLDLLGLWSGMKWRQKIICEEITGQAIKTLFFENGALPGTTTIDPKGINFASSIPRGKDFYLTCTVGDDSELPVHLTERKPKEEREKREQKELPETYIFVPFQVDSDTQIVEYSPWIRNMEQLYRIICKVKERAGDQLPVFIIKEHPSSKNDYSHLHAQTPGVEFYNQTNTQKLIEGARCVVTINSSVGFESILLNKMVITLGNAFYNIEGLVQHSESETDLLQACLNPLPVDQSLRKKVLGYLYNEYYVKGDWREAGVEHLNSIHRVIRNTLES